MIAVRSWSLRNPLWATSLPDSGTPSILPLLAALRAVLAQSAQFPPHGFGLPGLKRPGAGFVSKSCERSPFFL